MELNLKEEEMRPFMFSVLVVIASIAAVIVFLLTGGSAEFYIVAVIAVALGIYLASIIPKAEQKQAARKQKK